MASTTRPAMTYEEAQRHAATCAEHLRIAMTFQPEKWPNMTGVVQEKSSWALLVEVLDTIAAHDAETAAAEQRELEEIRRINEYEMWGPDGRPGG